MALTRVALVGDFNSQEPAHQAINRNFALANQSQPPAVEALWIDTDRLTPDTARLLSDCGGIWCVPASPYRNMHGALSAIRFARERSLPFLGTCGGFQHALIEYARNVLGLTQADHAETNPAAPLPLVTRLSCSLVDKAQEIRVLDNVLFRKAYGSAEGLERYRCNYGLNPTLEHLLADGALEIAARDERGEARAFVLKGHPFFVGTLFQPERRALEGALHPLVRAFFSACSALKPTPIQT